MSLHTLIYQSNTFGVTAYDMPATPDQMVTIQNGHFLPEVPLMLFGGLFLGANLTKVTLVTPRSRQVVPPVLYPIQQTLLPPDRPHFFDRRTSPFLLNALEEVSLQTNQGGAANANCTLILLVGNSIDRVPAGDIYSLHGTSTTAVVANAWSQIAVAYDQTLPAGTYAVVATQHQSTNALAHRLIFRQQNAQYRPGFASVTSLGNVTEPSYYYGGWGLLGHFASYAAPNVEVFCNAADAAHDVVLSIIRIG